MVQMKAILPWIQVLPYRILFCHHWVGPEWDFYIFMQQVQKSLSQYSMNTKCKHFSFFPYAWNKLTSQGSISPTDLKMNFFNSWSLFNGLSFRILLSVCFFLKLCSKVSLLSCQEWKAKFLLVAFILPCLIPCLRDILFSTHFLLLGLTESVLFQECRVWTLEQEAWAKCTLCWHNCVTLSRFLNFSELHVPPWEKKILATQSC